MKLILIRHGDAVAKDGAGVNYPLSPLGEEQVRRLADRLRQKPPDHLYASPILRAKQTAEAVAISVDRPIVFEPAFREIEVGEITGMSREERKLRYPKVFQPDGSLFLDFLDIGGEGASRFYERIASALRDVILDRHGVSEETVAVVAHGGVINAALAFFLEYPFGGRLRFRIENTSLTSFLVRDTGHPAVTGVNDAAHLAGLESAETGQPLNLVG